MSTMARDSIRNFMRDARDGTNPDDYDSAGMVKLYLKHGPPVYGWVDDMGQDGIIVLIVAVDRPEPSRGHDIADRYLTGDYPLYVDETEIAAFRFTDVHEFCDRTSTSY